MHLDYAPIPGLTPLPVQISGRWEMKTVTTDPPQYIPHTEYSIVLDVECSELFLPVAMLIDAGRGRFARPWRSKARTALQLRLVFFPCDWKHSDQVQINFEGVCAFVDSSTLKQDPRSLTETSLIGQGHEASTGRIITVAAMLPDKQVSAQLLLILKSDTEPQKGRWALKSSAAANLPEPLRFLSTGQSAGTF